MDKETAKLQAQIDALANGLSTLRWVVFLLGCVIAYLIYRTPDSSGFAAIAVMVLGVAIPVWIMSRLTDPPSPSTTDESLSPDATKPVEPTGTSSSP